MALDWTGFTGLRTEEGSPWVWAQRLAIVKDNRNASERQARPEPKTSKQFRKPDELDLAVRAINR